MCDNHTHNELYVTIRDRDREREGKPARQELAPWTGQTEALTPDEKGQFTKYWTNTPSDTRLLRE